MALEVREFTDKVTISNIVEKVKGLYNLIPPIALEEQTKQAQPQTPQTQKLIH